MRDSARAANAKSGALAPVVATRGASPSQRVAASFADRPTTAAAFDAISASASAARTPRSRVRRGSS